jgi:TusA-related sulfurtransferase
MPPEKIHILDCLGLYCPQPVFKTRIKLDTLEVGDLLEVIADDPTVEQDIPRLIQRLGHELVSRKEDDGVYHFRIKKTH